jgi:peroxiredoxin
MSEAPIELKVSQWFNTPQPIALQNLRGRVVVVGAFQMLCPGCVAQSIPQLKKLHDIFHQTRVIVLGLHTVFEHHAAMQPHALEAFIHEYRIKFPVGVDTHLTNDTMPQTMRELQLRGTPSTLIFDASGQLQHHQFGHVDDLVLGTLVGQLMVAAKNLSEDKKPPTSSDTTSSCIDDTCTSLQSDTIHSIKKSS